VSLKEDALRDTSVLNTLLNDVDGVIVEVVVDGALSDSIVLGRVFDNWLLEVSFEVKNLSVVLEPLGRNLGDCIVLLLLAPGDAGKILRDAFTHRSEEVMVDVLLEGGRLFLNSTILDAKKLSLVVSRDCGVRVNVAWQHRQFLWKIVHLHVLFLCSF